MERGRSGALANSLGQRHYPGETATPTGTATPTPTPEEALENIFSYLHLVIKD
jgi:hypothetical protein